MNHIYVTINSEAGVKREIRKKYVHDNQNQVLPSPLKLISELDMLLKSTGMERGAKRAEWSRKWEHMALGGISAWDAQLDFREVIN